MIDSTTTVDFSDAASIERYLAAIRERDAKATDSEVLVILGGIQGVLSYAINSDSETKLINALVRALAFIPKTFENTTQQLLTAIHKRSKSSSKAALNTELKENRRELAEARLRFGGSGASAGAVDELDPVCDLPRGLIADAQGNLLYCKPGDDEKLIANFIPRIVERIKRDDGETVDRRFTLGLYVAAQKGRSRYRLDLKDVAGADLLNFQTLVQRPEAIGRAQIEVGTIATSNQVLNNLSKVTRPEEQIPERTIYTHLGWSRDETFITHGEGTSIDVGQWTKLKSYALPPEDIGYAGRLCATKVIDLLRRFPKNPVPVAVAVLAAFAAPLTVYAPLNAVVCFSGRTGSGKSTMAVILSRFFGPFLKDTDLPGSFEGTLNSIEKLMYIAKDVPVVFDDLVKGAGLERLKAENLARRIIHSVAERTGRARLQRDLTERQTFTPRGVVVFTGEESPGGHSGLARTINVDFNIGDWDHATIHGALTELGPYLPHAMRHFIQWMQQETPALKERFLEHRERVRLAMQAEGVHGRTSDNLAHLAAVWDLLSAWLTHAGLKDPDIDAGILETLKILQDDQIASVTEADPMLGLLQTIAENRETWFATRCPLDTTDGTHEGWHHGVFSKEERDVAEQRQDAKDWAEGKVCGWYVAGKDHGTYFIIPSRFYEALNEAYRRSGRGGGFPLSLRQANRQLVERGWVQCSGQGKTARVTRIRGLDGTFRLIDLDQAVVDNEGLVTPVTF